MKPSLWLRTAALATILGAPVAAFSSAAVGTKITNRQLPVLGGGEGPLLGGDEARVSVFVFLRPDQEHSRQVLRGLAEVEEEMAARPVHWAAVVSSRFPAIDVATAVADAGIAMPVLIDREDALYGELGAALHPVLGMTDADHVLVAYQPFRKIHFKELLRARIRHQLGEISDAELAAVENPAPAAAAGGDPARRHLRLARMLLVSGRLDKALEAVARSLEADPESAEAHALRGSILASQDDCAAALEAFAEALRLDPEESTAREGEKTCRAADDPPVG